jgi:hypothetical protein
MRFVMPSAKLCRLFGLSIVVVLSVCASLAETLDGHHALGTVLNFTDDGDGVHSVTVNGKTFWWADPDGNGTAGPSYASAGLNMNGRNIARENSSTGITLNLDHTGNGSLGGSITNGGTIGTKAAAWNQNAGVLTITHAANVTVNTIDTSSQNLTAGGLTVNHTGNFSANSIVNDCKEKSQGSATFNGNQHGTAANNTFSAGTIRSRGLTPVGIAGTAGNVIIQNYHRVNVTGSMAPGSGDSETYGICANNLQLGGTAGNVRIFNIGAGGVTLTHGINTGFGYPGRTGHAWNTEVGYIEITTSGPIVVGSLFSGYYGNGDGNQTGKDITLTGESIAVTDGISCDYPFTSGGSDGILRMRSTGGAGSMIVVTNLNCALFNVANYTFAAYTDSTLSTLVDGGASGVVIGQITGVLSNFDYTAPTPGELRIPSGQIVHYDPELNSVLAANGT